MTLVAGDALKAAIHRLLTDNAMECKEHDNSTLCAMTEKRFLNGVEQCRTKVVPKTRVTPQFALGWTAAGGLVFTYLRNTSVVEFYCCMRAARSFMESSGESYDKAKIRQVRLSDFVGHSAFISANVLETPAASGADVPAPSLTL